MPSMTGFPLAPWHMWGSTVRVSLPLVAPASARTVGRADNVQVARVTYKRPETWSFLFGARIVDGAATDVNRIVITYMNLVLGVGRSVFSTKSTPPGSPGTGIPFVQFRWNIGIGENPVNKANNARWTTSVTSPPLDDTAADTHIIQWFPSENIQCEAYGQVGVDGASALDNSVAVEVSAYFAPRTHVRPDWLSDSPKIPQYGGHETGGT